MAIRWEGHLPQAMQRHTGSVKDAAGKPRPDNERVLPLIPEYGDPVWLRHVPDDDAERANEPAAAN